MSDNNFALLCITVVPSSTCNPNFFCVKLAFMPGSSVCSEYIPGQGQATQHPNKHTLGALKPYDPMAKGPRAQAVAEEGGGVPLRDNIPESQPAAVQTPSNSLQDYLLNLKRLLLERVENTAHGGSPTQGFWPAPPKP